MEDTENEVPTELRESLAEFDSALSNLEKTIQPWLQVPDIELKEDMTALDKAKMELVGAYTINSLFWMYLNVCGTNPKDHPVKQELERVRSYMNRVKDIQDKAKAPKVDQSAAKRFVKSALWQQAKNKNSTEGEAESSKTIQQDEKNFRKRNLDIDKHKHKDGIKKKKKKGK